MTMMEDTLNSLNASIANIPMPARMRRLIINEKGFPVPWFVACLDGKFDFRVIGPGKINDAFHRRLCWLCGEPLGIHYAFTIGPMCCVNRVNSEPPSHRDCAIYAAQACPFLSKPRMRRNEKDLPEQRQIAGTSIDRNPGAVAVYITRSFKLFKANPGVLFELGEPEQVLWFAEGRAAMHDEVKASIMSGLPLLQAEADKEGGDAMAALERCLARTWPLLPKA